MGLSMMVRTQGNNIGQPIGPLRRQRYNMMRLEIGLSIRANEPGFAAILTFTLSAFENRISDLLIAGISLSAHQRSSRVIRSNVINGIVRTRDFSSGKTAIIFAFGQCLSDMLPRFLVSNPVKLHKRAFYCGKITSSEECDSANA